MQSPAQVTARRGADTVQASVSWNRDGQHWDVEVVSEMFESTRARAFDAFEALCLVRDILEPQGWRIGVAGAQRDVWPSGMSRDQGGGLVAYRMTADGPQAVVDTFEPVDPATVTTVADQLAYIDELFEIMRQRGQ